MPKGKEITCEIITHIATLEEFASGWAQEFNIVRWNNNEGKFDIRPWSPDHKKCGRGITLFKYELEKVVEAYKEFKEKL